MRSRRFLNRRLTRRLTRRTTAMLGGRCRRRLVNHLANALQSLRRAIRAHRRLMKLDPARFDAAVMDHAEAEREKEAKRLASFKEALVKVYGEDAQPYIESHFASKPMRGFSSRKEAEIEREMMNWEVSLAMGRASFLLFHRHHQESRVTLSTICQLLEVASALGRLSTGLETTLESPSMEANEGHDFEEALRKVYGTPDADCTSVSNSPVQ